MVVTLEPTRNNASNKRASNRDQASSGSRSRFDIICELQSNLGIENLLLTFYEVLKESLPVDGLAYTEESRDLSIMVGNQASHACGYNLVKNGQQLGELRLSRELRFSEKEFVEIENLVALLLIPLVNALTYLDAVEKTTRSINSCFRNTLSQKELLGREIKLAQRHNQDMTLQLWRIEALDDDGEDNRFARDFASALTATCRSTDILLRPANTEFLVLKHKSRNISRNFDRRLQNNLAKLASNNHSTQHRVKSSSTAVSGTDTVDTLFSRLRNQLRDLPL